MRGQTLGRFVCIFAFVTLAACGRRADLDGRRHRNIAPQDAHMEHLSVGSLRRVAYDFFDNRIHATVVDNGYLLLACGSGDFVRYIEGGYRSSWHLHKQLDGRRVALVHGVAGEVYFPLDKNRGGIQRREDGALTVTFSLKPAQVPQRVSVFVNEHKLGDIQIANPQWAVYSIRTPAAALRGGENKLRMYFRHQGTLDGIKSAAAIEYIGIGPAKVSRKFLPPRLGQKVKRGARTVAALKTERAGRISFFVRVPPEKVQMWFSVASTTSSTMSVQVVGQDAAVTTLWSGQGNGTWTDEKVDISAYAGGVVRITFVASGAADWGRPRFVTEASPTNVQENVTTIEAKHIVVWAVASLRADRFASKKVPTPAFSRFVQRATWFRRAKSVAPAPGPTHVSVMSGKYANISSMSATETTLAEKLRNAGYFTALISGNGFVNDDAGFGKGFDVYHNPMRRRRPFGAQILWQTARQILSANRNRRTFIYIVTVEPHLPYTPSEASFTAEWQDGPVGIRANQTSQISQEVRRKKRTLTQQQRAYVEALYNAEVRDADSAFGTMVRDLDKLAITDDTAIVVFAGHGEEMWERGGFGHGKHLFEEVLHIPFAVFLPGSDRGRSIEDSVELVDVHPTVLHIAGIQPTGDIHGQSLMPFLQGESVQVNRPLFAHLPGVGRSITVGRYKWIVPLRGKRALFDLVEDPQESNNLAGTRPIVERYLRNVMGVGVGYERAWRWQRWGRADNLATAFAADHGL